MEASPVSGTTQKKFHPKKVNVLVGVVAGFVVLTALVTLIASFAKKLPVLIDQQFSTANAAETFSNPLESGKWTVSNGKYLLTQTDVANKDDKGNTNLSINNTEIKVGTWELSAEGKTNADFSVIFDYKDALNYSYANFSTKADANLHGVFKIEDGNQTKIADWDKSKLAAITADTNYRVEIRKKKDEVKVYADVAGKSNQYLGKATTKELATSKVGFGSRGGAATFDNLLVSGQGGVPATPKPTPTPPNPAPTPTPTPQPPTTTNPPSAPPLTEAPVGGRAIRVTNSTELAAALNNAIPGDVITMADGTYTAKGDSVTIGQQNAAAKFRITKSGTPAKPIVLQGTRNAIINGKPGADGTGGDYGLHVFKANYWVIKGIRITNHKKGIMLDGSNQNVIDGVMVDTIGHEGVHFRSNSSDNTIKNSFVTRTGFSTPGYGEGIYIGSDGGNWAKIYMGDASAADKADNSDRNKVLNNTITEFTGEGLDIKEASNNNVIKGNYFDGSRLGYDWKNPSAALKPQNSADSWIDIKGNDNEIAENTGVNIPALDKNSAAFQTHVHGPAGYTDGGQSISYKSAMNNKFVNNKVLSGNKGLGFWIDTGGKGNILSCSNIIASADKGFSNIGGCKETGN